MKLVKRPGNKFFEEDENTILGSDLTGIMDVCVDGGRAGEEISITVSYRFTDGPDHARQRQLFKTYGTTMVYVALPAVVGAKMCVNGETPHGVITPDSLEPERFFAGMSERGVPFEFEENTA
jgi:hypothetical protein